MFILAQTDFAQNVAKQLEVQKNRHALETDSHLRLLGTPLGDVYCIGDCSTVQNNVAANIYTFLKQVAWETGQDPETMQLDFNMWRTVAGMLRIPHRYRPCMQLYTIAHFIYIYILISFSMDM